MHSLWKPAFRMLLCASVITLTGSCATMDNLGADYGTAIGCGTGAVAGAVLGAVIGQKSGNRNAGMAIGAVAGGALGCTLGNLWQKREKALKDFAKRENVDVQIEALSTEAPVAGAGTPAVSPNPSAPAQSNQDAGLVANIQSSGMFDTDSDQFTADGLRQAKALAEIYKPQPAKSGQPPESTALLVVGHTDATGSAEHNQELSERRAHTMGAVLAEAGIDPGRVYFQGAGSGRPIADNTTEEGRARNRRVEITALNSSDLLIQRIRQEQASPKYLAHGTSVATAVAPAPAPVPAETPPAGAATAEPGQEPETAPSPAPLPAASPVALPPDFIDFGGGPISSDSNDLGAYIKPRQSGFSLINTAYADLPQAGNCHLDSPRLVGPVKNLATGQPLDAHETRDYFIGMNGRAWAGLVNGNLVTVTPVAVLKDSAVVAANPQTFVTRNYSSGKRKHSDGLASVANTYEGENSILYRVFVGHGQAPMECFDVVLPKDSSGIAPAGKLYYDHGGSTYVALFVPQRS